MKKPTIALFTAHSPSVGGGGAILRSLTANLPHFDIAWYYLNRDIVAGFEQGYLGQPIMGGPMLQDVLQTRRMLKGQNMPAIDDIVDKLLVIECDSYWIVSHNEGLRIAIELCLRQSRRSVHMTVHDDWAGALCARSVRYRLMSGVAKTLTIKALKTVTSFDVISAGMRDYYQSLTGISGKICHRYLPESSISVRDKTKNTGKVMVGHIGSIYNKKDLFNFVGLLKEFFSDKGQEVLLQMWGCHLTTNEVPRYLAENIQFFNTLSEDQVIPRLAACDFVYCMYPLSKSLHIFSKTSLPTKLSSYLQATRPIFGHGPADSTLAEFLSTTNLGGMWSSKNQQDGFSALEKILSARNKNLDWQAARTRYFGENNLQVMNKALAVV